MPYVKVGQQNSGPIEWCYEDHGSPRPVLIHDYMLSSRAWERQVPACWRLGVGATARLHSGRSCRRPLPATRDPSSCPEHADPLAPQQGPDQRLTDAHGSRAGHP
jgi:hypothetical protein